MSLPQHRFRHSRRLTSRRKLFCHQHFPPGSFFFISSLLPTRSQDDIISSSFKPSKATTHSSRLQHHLLKRGIVSPLPDDQTVDRPPMAVENKLTSFFSVLLLLLFFPFDILLHHSLTLFFTSFLLLFFSLLNNR